MSRSPRPRHALPLMLCLLLPAGSPGQVPAPAEDKPAGVTRDLPVGPERAREVLLALLEEAGLELDPEAEREEVVTQHADFGRDQFGEDVATPPPRFSPVYPYVQPVRVKQGSYRLRARFQPLVGGSRVTLVVEIVIQAWDRATHEQTGLGRNSNGTIEKHFFEKLESRVRPPSTQPAPRNNRLLLCPATNIVEPSTHRRPGPDEINPRRPSSIPSPTVSIIYPLISCRLPS